MQSTVAKTGFKGAVAKDGVNQTAAEGERNLP